MVTVLRNEVLSPANQFVVTHGPSHQHAGDRTEASRTGRKSKPSISVVDDIPRIWGVFNAVQANFVIGKIVMAEEFCCVNDLGIVRGFEQCFGDISLIVEPHQQFKQRVPLGDSLDPEW